MASIAVFAVIALTVIEASRGTIAAVGAETARARAQAAAEAGVAIALRDLLNAGPAGPPPIDGRVRHVRLAGADIAIAIEDEQGKIPINAIDEDQAKRMFEQLGLSGERLDIATDSFLDWTDEDDEPRPNGAEEGYYRPLGLHPRNGALRSVAETALIRGMDARLAGRLGRFATVHFGRGNFQASHASTEAIRVIEGDTRSAIDVINRQRELAGQQTALSIDGEKMLAGHPLTLRVEAHVGNDTRAGIAQIATLTGRASQPYALLERE